MKKVLIISYDFPPRRTSAVYRQAALSRYLVEQGWLPTVLTVETKPHDVVDLELEQKTPAEVRVVRTPYLSMTGWESSAATALRSVGGLKSRYDEARQPFADRWLRRLGEFVRSCFYFPDYSAGWIPFGFLQGLELCFRERFDAIFATSPPRSGPVIAALLKLLFRVPWVLELTDPWYPPARPLRRWFEYRLQSLLVRHAAGVVVLTEGHAQELRRRFKMANGAPTVIPNGFDELDFQFPQDSSGPQFETGYVHLTHFGAVYANHSGEFFPALAELLRERPALQAQLRVNIVGYPDEAIRRYAEQDGLREVTRLHSFVPHAAAVAAMRASDGLLVFLGDREFSRLAISGKVYEYLRTGRPILAIAHEGGLKQLLEESHAGWVAPPDDRATIKRILLEFADNRLGGRPQPGAAPSFTAQFRWDRLAERLSSVLGGVVNNVR